MAQLKRRKAYRSPPPLRIPSLPPAVRIEPKVEKRSKRRSNENSTENFSLQFAQTRMDSKLDDNVHQLRLRLIDSDLNHQRETTNEYIRRTQKEISLSTPTPVDPSMEDFRAPSALVQREIRPTNFSRQSTLPSVNRNEILFRDRTTTIDDDLRLTSDLEKELEIRQIQQSLSNVPRSRQTSRISNFPYDNRLHLYSSNANRQLSSSNMDDLIDSMARRHLAQRRLDVALEQQRRTSGIPIPYLQPVSVRRSGAIDEDFPYSSRSSRTRADSTLLRTGSNVAFGQLLRSRIEHYRRLEPENENFDFEENFRGNHFAKLPPISPAGESRRISRDEFRATPRRRFALETDRSEHLIELPSDIFLAVRNENFDESRRRTFSKPRTERSQLEIETALILQPTDENEENFPIGNFEKQDFAQFSSEQAFFTEAPIVERRDVRNLFKNAARVTFFLVFLRRQAARSKPHRAQLSRSAAIHKIRLQEIIVGLHRTYLEPGGPIHSALLQSINSPINMADGLKTSSKNFGESIDLIADSLKNIVENLVDFMPRDGIVGTGKDSAVSFLMQDGNPFPDNYFWQCEKNLLKFDGAKVIQISKQRAVLLFIGIFVFRSLVTTLLIKPIKYRLVLGSLTTIQAANIKILASIILYVARRVVVANGILPMPTEWQLSLHGDETMRPIIENPQIQPIIKNCEASLEQWAEKYIARIDSALGREPRT